MKDKRPKENKEKRTQTRVAGVKMFNSRALSTVLRGLLEFKESLSV